MQPCLGHAEGQNESVTNETKKEKKVQSGEQVEEVNEFNAVYKRV